MKVLHINQSDTAGGAALAGYRLHQSLLNQKIDSRQLVGVKQTSSDRVAKVPRSPYLEQNIGRLTYRLGLNYLNYQTFSNISKHDFYLNADILNFHNLHSNYFNYLDIAKLTRTKPAVFTLHDMWSFTGHCSYSYDCGKWQTGCGQCPYLNTYPATHRDITALEWKLKQRVYSQSNLAIVAPSLWLYQQAQQSLLNRFSIHHIPYGIDTTVYQPLDPDQCRAVLNIPQGKQVLLFAAASLADDRKGGDLLFKALLDLPQSLKAETVLLVMGSGGDEIEANLGISTINLGYISSDRIKAIAYSAADLFIFPTRADNLPLVLQESMACGTPMVSFKIGGVPDLVRPGETGYLAAPEDIEDFRQGIIQLLENAEHRHQMRQTCRAIALQEYTLELQAQRYMQLYQQRLAI
ncbi:glycosyltransferase family 4 protein [Alkalinema pantanalense CENA528]|uniref:glycosyltransferase family 4 protein n=1 Tax=Alkalinema pantanalense TaxID=1620705 RepID=UPI003D6E302C